MTMQGKTVVVTGGTDGIGKVAARELAKAGAEVTIVSRNQSKGERTLEELRQSTANKKLQFICADLSLLSGTSQAAAQLKQKHARIDVLLNNAGAMFQKREVTADGFEKTFALNHLGYFALTLHLLPELRAASNGRVVNVASAAHAGAKLDLNDLHNEKRYSGWVAYGQSKLANIYFTYELSRRLGNGSVTANCLHPGFVATAFGDNNAGFLKMAIGAAKKLGAISDEDGAKTSVYLASSAEVQGVSGRYFDKCKAIKSSAVSYDDAIARALWEKSEHMSGLTFK